MRITPETPNPRRSTYHCNECGRGVGVTVTVIDGGYRNRTLTEMDEGGWLFSDMYGWLCPKHKNKGKPKKKAGG